MSKEESKRYKIDSFERLLNVLTLDNLENISIDLIEWMATYISYVENIRKEHPEKTEGRSNWEVMQASFIYIDDGENGIKFTEITNKETGEIKTIQHKKP